MSETFLRCVDMGYDQDLAVIELNGLKIAEARDFADNASFIMTTILSLCLPAAPRVREEYRPLFPGTAPDSKTLVKLPTFQYDRNAVVQASLAKPCECMRGLFLTARPR